MLRILGTKVQRIQAAADSAGNYFESNHMFLKSLVGAIMDAFEDVYCIYLHRDLTGLLMSASQRGRRKAFPLDFQLQPHWKNNLLRTSWSNAGFYETIAFNWYEIKERWTQAWQPKFVKTFDFDFRQINDPAEWRRLFNHFGIPVKPFNRLPKGLSTHASGYTEALYPKILAHLKKHWDEPGDPQRFTTDKKRLALEAAE